MSPGVAREFVLVVCALTIYALVGVLVTMIATRRNPALLRESEEGAWYWLPLLFFWPIFVVQAAFRAFHRFLAWYAGVDEATGS